MKIKIMIFALLIVFGAQGCQSSKNQLSSVSSYGWNWQRPHELADRLKGIYQNKKPELICVKGDGGMTEQNAYFYQMINLGLSGLTEKLKGERISEEKYMLFCPHKQQRSFFIPAQDEHPAELTSMVVKKFFGGTEKECTNFREALEDRFKTKKDWVDYRDAAQGNIFTVYSVPSSDNEMLECHAYYIKQLAEKGLPYVVFVHEDMVDGLCQLLGLEHRQPSTQLSKKQLSKIEHLGEGKAGERVPGNIALDSEEVISNGDKNQTVQPKKYSLGYIVGGLSIAAVFAAACFYHKDFLLSYMFAR